MDQAQSLDHDNCTTTMTTKAVGMTITATTMALRDDACNRDGRLPITARIEPTTAAEQAADAG
jgi:hypothetical protein